MATLYVLEQGAEIRCDGERLAIWQTDQELGNVPMAKLEDIVVMGNIGFSTPAIKRLLDQQIEVTFLTIHGRYHGRLIGEATAHVALRRNQYRRADDEAWALAMAQACVSGKLRNCRAVLQRFARNRQQVEKEVLESIEALEHFIDRVDRTTKISSLVGVEGSGSAAYFGGLRSLFDSEWMFNNRNRRPPTDPVNVLLSLGYTLLVHKTLGAVQAVGFDPYQGFLHQLDYNRPSLVLDLIEEFRPILVDALVIRCCNDGRLTANDFSPSDDPKHPILLSNEGKKRFVAAFEERMRTEVTHPDGADGRPSKVSYWRCIELQARLLARAIQTGTSYQAWTTR